jgi:putative ABC transport system ATP-binding protein
MNILGCLDVPTSGTYRFRGVTVTGLSSDQRSLLRQHYLGFVFQGYNLLGRTSALENVELPLIYRRVRREERRHRALRALGEVGLSDRARHTPAELSGGQQQRVAIARAIVSNPLLLLADEPTGNLDTTRKHEIMRLLAELNEQRGITIVMVTHERSMADYASRIVEFLDGRIERDEPNSSRRHT